MASNKVFVVNANYAGFFSNWLKILDWIRIIEIENHNLNIKVVTNWDGWMEDNQNNVWQSLFQSQNYNSTDKIVGSANTYFARDKNVIANLHIIIPSIPSIISTYCNYFFGVSTVYHDPEFNLLRQKYHEAYKKLSCTPKINEYVKNIRIKYELDEQITWLGVHIRSPFYYKMNLKISEKDFVTRIVNDIQDTMKLTKSNGLFIATQYEPMLDAIKCSFCDDIRIVYIDTYRTQKNIDWVISRKENNISILNEVIDVWTDVQLLSKCQHVLGGSSNVFFATLIINPNVPFTLFNTLKNVNHSTKQKAVINDHTKKAVINGQKKKNSY